jgi:arginyl-tRNA synthetase
MKQIIQQEIQSALATQTTWDLPASFVVQVDYARDEQHGDYSSNVALVLAKSLQQAPRQVAEHIRAQIDLAHPNSLIEKIEIAGPGFINFFLKKTAWQTIVGTILTKKEQFGQQASNQETPILIEFVSSNPTGPLHVGHGRGAAYGDTLVRLLKAAGYSVQSEYYVNDAGRQIAILATSVWLRYLEICGETIPFPSNAYQGAYIRDIAQSLREHDDQRFYHPAEQVFNAVPPDEQDGGDKEIHIDALITRAQQLLGEQAYQEIVTATLKAILGDIENDLCEFRVVFDCWYSERSLFQEGVVDETIARLKARGVTYSSAGALWFRSTEFGDDKDRVLVRENGQATYFAADAAYRLAILEKRGFNRMINILGADHHGYVARIRAVIEALGYSGSSLEVLLVQFANLYRGKEKLPMSTRSGEFVTLRQLREEVGSDAARFFYVLRRADQHMDFDLQLAKKQSNENPVYYVQYAYARICSVFRQLSAKNQIWDSAAGCVGYLQADQEITLCKWLTRYPEVLKQAAEVREPHLVAHYLIALAQNFHTYYNQHVFLVEESDLRNARLNLIAATQWVIKNGLTLLGVETMEVM